MKFIIPIIVGAAIGYTTNWLAIKMLFRPYQEKKFLGMTIPFTPGLIPKEKERIAKSVGLAVGEHILSPDVIAESLSSDSTDQKVRRWIEEKYYSLKANNRSIHELLKENDTEAINNIVNLLSGSLTDSLFDQVRVTAFEERIIEYIEKNLYEEYKASFLSVLNTKGSNYIVKFINSPQTKALLEDILLNNIETLKSNELYLENIVPIETQDAIKSLLQENKANIGEEIRNLFNDPMVRSKLSKSISEMVEQNVNSVITMFISSDQISDKILQVVEKYINDDKSYDDYIMIIGYCIDKLMKNKVSDLTRVFKPLINQSEISDISTKVLNSVSDTEINGLIKAIEENIIEKELQIKEYIFTCISKFIENLIQSLSFKREVLSFIKDLFIMICNKPLSLILEKVDDNTMLTLISVFKSLFNTFSENELPRIIEFFEVSTVVEDQINSFDVEYTERLILEIANKELKAITWLGALLGGIMGMLSPFLQML